jgi:hypothetical protein
MGQRIAGREIEGELQVKNFFVSFSHDARTRGSMVMGIHPTDEPRPVLALLFFKDEILLKMKPIALPVSVSAS